MTKGQAWDDATTSRLRALREEGHSLSEIGRRLGVSKNAVGSKVYRLNVSRRYYLCPPVPPKPRRIMFCSQMLWVTKRLHEIGETRLVIADRLGVSPPVVTKKLAELGYELNSRCGYRHPRLGLRTAYTPPLQPREWTFTVDDTP